MAKLRDEGASVLSTFTCDVSEAFFVGNTLNTGAVNCKTFILLLAQKKPLSFASGAPVALARVLADYNRSEFHHIYPRAFLRTVGIGDDFVNVLANFAFISAIDNKTIGGDAPSVYKVRMAQNRLHEIAASAFLPKTTWTNDFLRFPRRAV